MSRAVVFWRRLWLVVLFPAIACVAGYVGATEMIGIAFRDFLRDGWKEAATDAE